MITEFEWKVAIGTPAGAEKIGSDLHLFRSRTDTATCVIDAHGGFIFENRSFTVPDGVTLKFHADHGNRLTDTGLQGLKIATGEYKPVAEILGGGDCHDYLLTKAWGARTFDDAVDEEFRITYARARGSIAGGDRAWQKAFFGHTFDDVASLVTVRNRWDRLCGIPLKDVIREVRKAMPSLTTFRCSFCRSAPFGFGEMQVAQRR